MTSDVVVYLCPVVFGQFSANMKYAIDRWLPNMLPYFITKDDGSTRITSYNVCYTKLLRTDFRIVSQIKKDCDVASVLLVDIRK